MRSLKPEKGVHEAASRSGLRFLKSIAHLITNKVKGIRNVTSYVLYIVYSLVLEKPVEISRNPDNAVSSKYVNPWKWDKARRCICKEDLITSKGRHLSSLSSGDIMNFVKVPGKNRKHKVLLYALSTCAWCRMEKQFLKDNSVEFEYVDVDLCDQKEREKIRADIQQRGGEPNYPTLIVDDKNMVTGFHENEIQKALEF